MRKRQTHTVQYYMTESSENIAVSINEYETDGWHVHQIVPRAAGRTVGNISINESEVFVVYAKDGS